MRSLTYKLRIYATWFWSIGLALVAFDHLTLFAISEGNIIFSYIFFTLAGLSCWWAEKREFGMRVSLYRLHDIAISGPWKYLLLYFLWVNLFAPFTDFPRRSVIYACAGWFSLVAVAFSAQFIFCERTIDRVAFIPSRLRVVFHFYAVSVILLATSFLLSNFFPEVIMFPFSSEWGNSAVFLVSGMPFLIWDFVHPKRRLLSRYISAFAVVETIVVFFIMRDKFFLLAAAMSGFGLIALGLVKRIRMLRPLVVLLVLSVLAVNAMFLLNSFLDNTEAQQILYEKLHRNKEVVREKVVKGVEFFQMVQESNFLGIGIGSTKLERGVWFQIFLEVGIIGLLLYAAFFVQLLWDCFQIRRSSRVVVSNVAFLSIMIFLIISSHFPKNPYGTGIWIWYAIWGIFASTRVKKELKVFS